MSRIIITTNPIIAPMVARSEFPPLCDSGINSSITTYIIAPAAKLNAYGSIGFTNSTAPAPITALNGSTIAESWPYQKHLNRDIPSLRRGAATANPSGKFWIPMPIARVIAAIKVAEGKPDAAAPKATPIARPSGIL